MSPRLSFWSMCLFGAAILGHQIVLKYMLPRKHTHEPRGYTQFVEKNLLGERSLLEGEFVSQSARNIDKDSQEDSRGVSETADKNDVDLVDAGESNDGLLEAQTLVSLRLDEERLQNAPALVQNFVNNSYLRKDLAFPSRFRYRFSDRGNVLDIIGLRDDVHRRYLPFSENVRYQGDILFRQDKPYTVLRDKNQHRIALKRGEGAAVLELAPGQKREDLRAEMLDIRIAGESIATLRPLGDALMIRVFQGLGKDYEVRLNGKRLPADAVRRLMPSDLVYFSFPIGKNKKGDDYLAVEEVRDGVVSTVRLTDQGKTRIPEEERIPGFSHALEGAIDSLLLRFSQESPSTAKRLQNVTMRLSLAEPLQRVIQEQLVLFARKIDGIGSKAKEPFRQAGPFRAPPIRAAVTILDAMTGEVLALASYPDEETLDTLLAQLEEKAVAVSAQKNGEYLRRATLLRREEIDRLRGQLLENQNLPLHQIGSIFKPLFAFALFAIEPSLKSLAVAGHGENDNRPVLGYDMGKFSDHAHGDWVDARRFLAQSCQRYMEHLGILALGEREGLAWKGLQEGAGETRLGEVQYRGVLSPQCSGKNLCFLQPQGKTFELRNIEKAPIFRELEKRYDVTIARWNTNTLPDSALFDHGPWKETLQGLSAEGGGELESLFSRVSPVKTVLYIDDFRLLYRDYTQFLKGSGRNVWSNLGVAQAIARLVTGRQTNAWLGRLELGEKPPETCSDGSKPRGPFARCPAKLAPTVEPGAWEAVLSGMEAVSEEGTARRLDNEVEQAKKDLAKTFSGESFRYLSKTGSVRRPWSLRLLLEDKGKRVLKNCPGAGLPRCPSWLRNGEKDSLPGANYVFALVGGPTGGLPTRGVVAMVYIADAGGSQVATEFVETSKLIPLLTQYMQEEANP